MQPRFAIAAGLCLFATLVALPVISVRSAITPAPDGPSDAWLTTTAKIAILTSIGTRGTLQIDTMNATMTLYGNVASPEEKENAGRLAGRVKGVGEVRNWLTIAPVAEQITTAASDSALRSETAVALIAAGLKKNSPLGESLISVQAVENGTVILAGTANNLTAHLHAIETVNGVQGVRAVRSDIRDSGGL